jgi:hypothetical protein
MTVNDLMDFLRTCPDDAQIEVSYATRRYHVDGARLSIRKNVVALSMVSNKD